MSKEKPATDQATEEKKAEHKREKKREKARQELLAGVKKGDQKEEDKEKVISAVADEMLKIFSKWPEAIQALVGTEQPNKENFVLGIPYVVRAYLHKAREGLRAQTRQAIRDAEVLAAKSMGPLHHDQQRLISTHKRTIDSEVESLKTARDKEIKESERAIRSRYNALITGAMGRSSEELNQVLQQMADIETSYIQTKDGLEEDERRLLTLMANLESPYAEPIPVPKSKPAVQEQEQAADVG